MRVVFILGCLVASFLSQRVNGQQSSDVAPNPPANQLGETAALEAIGTSPTQADSKPKQKKCRKRHRPQPKIPSCRQPKEPTQVPAGSMCFSVEEILRDAIESTNSSLSPTLINLQGNDRSIDLSSYRRPLEPLITRLQTEIEAIKNANDSDSTGALNEMLLVLQDLLKTLLSDEPIKSKDLASKLLEDVMLLIGSNVVGQEAGGGQSTVLSNVLSSIAPMTLQMVGNIGVTSRSFLETVLAAVKTLSKSGVDALFNPDTNAKQKDKNSGGGGGLINAVLSILG